MKGFEKFILVVFSIIIIMLVVGSILISTEMIKTSLVTNALIDILVNNKLVVIVVGAIFTIFALIGIFTGNDDSDSIKAGLVIKSDNGSVYITKETFENIILSVTREFASLKNTKVMVDIDETGVKCKVLSYILPNTIVPDVTARLQKSIKEAINKQTTIEISDVEIKIKGVVYEQTEKKQ